MKYALLVILAATLYMGISCSPVKFNSVGHPCDVSSPCVTSTGLYTTTQDFTFNATNKVDILIVDDNSGSMTTEQENLGTPLNGFISNLNSKGLDWQVAVTNTDVCGAVTGQPAGFCPGPSNIPGADGKFMGPYTGSGPSYGNQYIIKTTTPNADTVFHNTVQRQNEIGSGDERGIYAVNLAISQKDSADAGFFRDNSNLAVVFLSDEDERSVGGLNTNDPGYAALEANDEPQSLINNVATTWNGAKKMEAYSIIIKPNDSSCLSTQSAQGPYYTAHYGATYAAVSQQTNGAIGSICDNGSGSFANMLSSITGDIVNQINGNSITLAYIPAAQPTVTFSPASNQVAWTWSGNTITFNPRPVNGTTVTVTYNFSSTNNKVLSQQGRSPYTFGVSK